MASKLGSVAFATAIAIGVVAISGKAAGLKWNATSSAPEGIWRMMDVGPLKDGDTVFICPPRGPAILALERGYISAGSCPDGSEMLIKPLAALPGDRVTVDDDGISVNDKPLSDSAPMQHDSAGRSMPTIENGVYEVGDNEVWVISGHDHKSYDSRYFGAIPMTSIQGRAVPVLVGK